MPPFRLISRLRVRSCDVDSFGHVNNAVYLQYCEGARNDYLLERGLKFADFERWNAGPVLIRATLDYRRPARVDDELDIAGTLEFTGRTRFTIHHEFVRVGDQATICRATLEFAFVNLAAGRPCAVPPEFVRAFDGEIDPVKPG